MSEPENLEHELRFAHLKAWLVLSWERFWPLVLPFMGVVAGFLIISWLGGWPLLDNAVRWAVLALFAVGAIWSLKPLSNLRFPGRSELNSHIEIKSGLSHRPVSAQDDVLADLSASDDAFSRALWSEHRRRMAKDLKGLRSGLPNPSVAKKDPFALRAIVGLILFVAIMAGWGNLSGRIGDAFRSNTLVDEAGVSGRIDAWIKPPVYTNKPPVFLSRSSATQAFSTPDTIIVPEGSELVVRLLGMKEPGVKVVTEGDEMVLDEDVTKTNVNAVSGHSAKTFKGKLLNAGEIVLSDGQSIRKSWAFSVTPDEPPVIEFSGDPTTSTTGQFELSYTLDDDYGVARAIAEMEPVTPVSKNARPLVEIPEIQLVLPSRRAKRGNGKTSKDLSDHPLAGSEVNIVLKATDDAGKTGESARKVATIPGRIFTKPLAKALVFERRRLAMDANMQRDVSDMLDVITSTHPDLFIPKLAHYTALRVAYRHIKRATSDEALIEGLDLLWQVALAVENGDLSLAEQRLRDAQERLADALERGASDEEISKLMQELRQAMNEFLKELQNQFARNQQNQQAQQLNPNTQMLRQQDFEDMLKRMEDLAKSGSKDAARELLRQMQEMLNNLQMAQPGQNQQQTDPFSQQMNELGEMMQRQQQLMDQTFDMQRRQQQQRQGNRQQGQQDQNGQQQRDQQQGQRQGQQQQQGEGQGQQPMTAEEFAEAMKRLQEQQGQLREQMQQMQQGMRDLGLNPGQSMNDAGEAMGQAEGNLGEGQTGQATENQGRALQAMREGAQQMMQQMQQQAGEQGRRGERGQHGEQTRQDSDPLGRQSRSQGPQLGDETKVPSEIDAQRAREILEAIRKRLGEAARPKLELDYLDRLLPSR